MAAFLLNSVSQVGNHGVVAELSRMRTVEISHFASEIGAIIGTLHDDYIDRLHLSFGSVRYFSSELGFVHLFHNITNMKRSQV